MLLPSSYAAKTPATAGVLEKKKKKDNNRDMIAGRRGLAISQQCFENLTMNNPYTSAMGLEFFLEGGDEMITNDNPVVTSYLLQTLAALPQDELISGLCVLDKDSKLSCNTALFFLQF